MKKRMLVTMVSVLFVLSMVSAVLAQQQAPAGPPPAVKEMVAKAKGSIQKVTAADVKAACPPSLLNVEIGGNVGYSGLGRGC